jgi:hypothetical protein
VPARADEVKERDKRVRFVNTSGNVFSCSATIESFSNVHDCSSPEGEGSGVRSFPDAINTSLII